MMARQPQFTCRIEQANGAAIEGLVANSRIADDPQTAPQGYRWLSFAIPRVARTLRVPALRDAYLVFVGNKQVPAAAEIALPRGARTVTLRVSAREVLDHPFALSTTPAHASARNVESAGAGTLLRNHGLREDRGRAGVAPGGTRAPGLRRGGGVRGSLGEWQGRGKRPWAPYVFDVTEQLHAGKNQIKVRVANTEGNARAVGTWRDHLENIDVDGWHGPARLVPFVEREITCSLVG